MVLACDLVVASRRARFALPEVKRGLLALYGGVFRGARALPLNLAREMVLTGEPIDAERAHALGLVNRLCDDGAALDTALALAEAICANSPVAVRESLRVINQSHRRRRRAGLAAQQRGRGHGARLRRQPRGHRRLPGKARTASGAAADARLTRAVTARLRRRARVLPVLSISGGPYDPRVAAAGPALQRRCRGCGRDVERFSNVPVNVMETQR